VTTADLLAAEICLRDAWPAIERVDLVGWMLRAGMNGYNRTNSVWPGRFTGGIDLGTAIDRVEAFYGERGLPSRFQVLQSTAPAHLDRALEERGYRRETDCSTLAKPVTATVMPDNVAVTARADPAWLEIYAAGQSPRRATEVHAILARLPMPRAFFVTRINGAAAAVALAVRVGADVAVDCVLTSPDRRRGGAATAVMQAAEAWSADEGVRRMLLVVINANTPAMALYAGLGFTRLSGYHYRIKEPGLG
jgi:N-acetylglutamate synthase